MTLTREELNRLRQWYNYIYDTAPSFLQQADADLAIKIITANSVMLSRSAIVDKRKSEHAQIIQT